ncbi:MAG: hypothetical protein ABI321_10480 [Polyangia bacterium]
MMNKKARLAAPFVLTALLSGGAALADAPKKLPKAEYPDHVQRAANGICTEYWSAACPPGAHCNPGPPHAVECPPEPPKKK